MARTIHAFHGIIFLSKDKYRYFGVTQPTPFFAYKKYNTMVKINTRLK
jgi:hypothetical protein